MSRIWKQYLEEKNSEENLKSLKSFIKSEKKDGKIIYPAGNLIFNAFDTCSFEKIKVVIIGEEPYNTPNTADGLAYSAKGSQTPPMLYNVFKEVFENTRMELQEINPKVILNIKDLKLFASNNLTEWSEQGVFLLNTILTVEQGKPFSHSKKGWEKFAAETIKFISENKNHVVWMLWGEHAQKAEKYIDRTKSHLILKANHPSPIYANKGGWAGTNHFYKCNQFLKELRLKTGKPITPINWGIFNDKL